MLVPGQRKLPLYILGTQNIELLELSSGKQIDILWCAEYDKIIQISAQYSKKNMVENHKVNEMAANYVIGLTALLVSMSMVLFQFSEGSNYGKKGPFGYHIRQHL